MEHLMALIIVLIIIAVAYLMSKDKGLFYRALLKGILSSLFKKREKVETQKAEEKKIETPPPPEKRDEPYDMWNGQQPF